MERPDKDIEEFWLGIKTSMVNFYKSNFYKNNFTCPRPIGEWSDELNMLQQIQDYDTIQQNIREHISLYALDVIRFNDNNNRHFKILLTNIKRWNKISEKYSFLSNNCNEYYNIVYLIIDLYKTLMDIEDINVKIIFSQVELLIINKDFSKLIKYSVENNKPSIIDKLSKYIDINIAIKKLYGKDIPNNLSTKKLISLINL